MSRSQSLAQAGVTETPILFFCETCIHWTRHPDLERENPGVALTRFAPFGRCALTGETEFSHHLCGQWRHTSPRVTLAARRQNEHPSRRHDLDAAGHCFGDALLCVNHPPGEPDLVCAHHWEGHQESPGACPYEHIHKRHAEAKKAKALDNLPGVE